jgi:choline dehydrogenase-like flavoprotein
VEKVHRGVKLLAEQMFAAGARKVLLPFGNLPELDSADDLRVIDKRKHVKHDLELMTVHIMSTCKMAATPEAGPCDNAGRLRGYAGLVVADASAIPSSVGVNPMETIVALSLRNADRWTDDLLRGVV